MRRFWAVAAGVIGVVAIVVFARALLVSAPPVSSPGSASINVDSRGPANHLAQAIRFATVSYGGRAHEAEKFAALEAMRAWMEQTYPNFHRAATREVFDHSLLFVWKGRRDELPPVLLMAHMDVVPVVPGTERDWKHQPFSGDIADGFVWGRGALDDKFSLIMLLEAAERLAAANFTPERTIYIAFGQDEEVGGDRGTGVIAKALAARNVHFAWVMDEGGAIAEQPAPGIEQPMALVSVAEKGYLSLELVAHGQGGHSSRPTKDLAIARLNEAVLKVVCHPFRSGIDLVQANKFAAIAPYAPFGQRLMISNLWLFGPLIERIMEAIPDGAARLHTTIAPTMEQAGVKDNVLPPEARATINFRLHPRDSVADVVAHVRRAIGDPKVDVNVLSETRSEASGIADMSGPAGKYLADTIQQSFGGIPVAPDTTTGATDSRHYLPIADEVFRFAPFRLGPEDLGRVHGTDERAALGDLGPAVGFYMRLIRNMK